MSDLDEPGFPRIHLQGSSVDRRAHASRAFHSVPPRAFGAWECLCHVLRVPLPPVNQTSHPPGSNWVLIGERLLTAESKAAAQHALDACRVILGLDTLYAPEKR